MNAPKVEAERWCDAIGHLVADALVDAGLITTAQLEKAQAVIAEEVFARLAVQDYPPRVDFIATSTPAAVAPHRDPSDDR